MVIICWVCGEVVDVFLKEEGRGSVELWFCEGFRWGRNVVFELDFFGVVVGSLREGMGGYVR